MIQALIMFLFSVKKFLKKDQGLGNFKDITNIWKILLDQKLGSGPWKTSLAGSKYPGANFGPESNLGYCLGNRPGRFWQCKTRFFEWVFYYWEMNFEHFKLI